MVLIYFQLPFPDLHKIRNEWGESTRYPCIPGG